jgi:predicted HTH transcriptional regulator
VDFKLQCSAFLGREKGERAELAKDICAMADNGNVAKHIIIGVSDDGKSFESVANPQLTDDNLQSFCKTALFPPVPRGNPV